MTKSSLPLSLALSEQVRSLRADRAMTRAELARRSGISLAYLAKLEAGTANITLNTLEDLAGAFDLPAVRMLELAQDPDGHIGRVVALLETRTPTERADACRLLAERFGKDTPGTGNRRIALVGLRGAGKSTLGPRLAERLGLPFVELNREIERLGGIPVPEIFTLYGAAGYRQLEASSLERVMAAYPAVVLATGGGIVSQTSTYARLRGAFQTIWLRAEPEEHFERVQRQRDSRIATPELKKVALANIRVMLAARESLYGLADRTLDTTGLSLDACVEAAVSLIARD